MKSSHLSTAGTSKTASSHWGSRTCSTAADLQIVSTALETTCLRPPDLMSYTCSPSVVSQVIRMHAFDRDIAANA